MGLFGLRYVCQRLLKHCSCCEAVVEHILLVSVRLLYSLLSFYIFLFSLIDILMVQDPARRCNVFHCSRHSNYCRFEHTILTGYSWSSREGWLSLCHHKAASSS